MLPILLTLLLVPAKSSQPLDLDALVTGLRQEFNPWDYTQEELIRSKVIAMAPLMYRAYEQRFSHQYTAEERLERFKLFEASLRKYLSSARSETWEPELNQFADKSQAELDGYLGYNRTREMNLRGSIEAPTADVAQFEMVVGRTLGWPLYPDKLYVDWRERGALTPSEDQGECGVCWAFSSASVIESLYFIKTGVLRGMSIQQIVDCTYSTNGCAGGWYGDVYSYIKTNNKLSLSEQYPLTIPRKLGGGTTVNKGCNYNLVQKTDDALKVAYLGQAQAAYSEEGIIMALSQHPINAGMYVPESLYSYKSGVFVKDNCPNNVEMNNHAVVLAGYTDNTFLIKNSWGTKWGERGYFRLFRGPSCGIMTDVMWPTMYTYSEKDPHSPYIPCQDRYAWCPAFAERSCAKSRTMRRMCPYSCAACSCRDVIPDCAAQEANCAADAQVRTNCRRTCGLCFCPPGTSLCKTRCLPYWDKNFKKRYCDVPVANNEHESEGTLYNGSK